MLKVKLSKTRITIEIDPDTLKFATENHPEFYDGETRGVTVKNKAEWMKSVYESLLEEQEDGSTLVSLMLDNAIRVAVENGEDGINYES